MLDLSLMLHRRGLMAQLLNQAAFRKSFIQWLIINGFISASSFTSASQISQKSLTGTHWVARLCTSLW